MFIDDYFLYYGVLKYIIYILLILLVSCQEFTTNPEEEFQIKTETKFERIGSSGNIIYIKNFDRQGNVSSIVQYKDEEIYTETEFIYNESESTQVIYNYEQYSERTIHFQNNDNLLQIERESNSVGEVIRESRKFFDNLGNLIKIETNSDDQTQIKEFEYIFDSYGQISGIYVKIDGISFLQDSIVYETNKITRFNYDPNGELQNQVISEFKNDRLSKESILYKRTGINRTFIYRYTFY